MVFDDPVRIHKENFLNLKKMKILHIAPIKFQKIKFNMSGNFSLEGISNSAQVCRSSNEKR